MPTYTREQRAAAALELRRRQKHQDYSRLWSPKAQNKPQQQAYYSEADRIFYGGAAGGGKTDLLLGLAFTAHDRSIIFRREYPQLASIEDRSREIAAGQGSYNSSPGHKKWSGLPGSRVIEFGAVQHEKDKEKYQGRPHDLIGFDELTHFTRSQFDFLTGWNRSTKLGQRCRIVCTGNPPTTPEGQWVKEYWGPWLDSDNDLYPHPPGKLLWFATVSGKDVLVDGSEPFEHEGETVIPHSRTFIPASLQDNPDLAGTNYASVLQAMPEPLRSQMLHGSFDVTPLDDPWQVIPTAWVDAAIKRWKDRENQESLSALGVDVARGGKDETIIVRRCDNYYEPLISFPGSATPDGSMVAAQVVEQWRKGAAIFVDVVGVGSSVYDALSGSYEVYAVSGGEAAGYPTGKRFTDKPGNLEFTNLRSWMIWRFREMLDPESGLNLYLPPDSKMKADLCAPRWKLTPPISSSQAKGRIQVESKDDIKKRLGRSPDRGDAIVYASLDVEFFSVGRQFGSSRAYW